MRLKLPDGREVNGVEVGLSVVREEWSEFRLENGKVLRVKPVGLKVYELDDLDPLTGEPDYLVRSQTVISVSSPREEE
ncbi:MAG: hypothetical protein QXS27_05110 [Candidatus Jordarchaeaceae archaeon]